MTSLTGQPGFLLREVGPALMEIGSTGDLVVWTLGDVDDALALALAHLHDGPWCRVGDLRIFHSGQLPSEPVTWRLGGSPSLRESPWVLPVPGRVSRWSPSEAVMERVVLSEPPWLVDAVVAPSFLALTGSGDGPVLDRLRKGGLVIVTGSPVDAGVPPSSITEMPGNRRIYRKTVGHSWVGRADTAGSTRTYARLDLEIRLIESHRRLALALARRYAHHGESLDDLQQVAMYALVKAARRYTAGTVPFGGFAATCITGEIKRHFRDKVRRVRVPRRLQEIYAEVQLAREELTHRYGTTPTVDELAEYLHVSSEAVKEAVDAAEISSVTSLEIVTEPPVADLARRQTDPDGFDGAIDRLDLQSALPRLQPVDQVMLRRLYFENRTQHQIADEVGVSQMHVSRGLSRILSALRVSMSPSA